MSLQSNNRATTTRKNRRIVRHQGNGTVSNAQHDLDVIRMVSAEVGSRAAAHHTMVANAAYFRAEKRGFEPGHELDDWLAAEAEVAREASS